MTPLTLEQRTYKDKTLNKLLADQAELQIRVGQETRSEELKSIRSQLEEVQAHIEHLQMELEHDVAGAPVADELCKKIATALTKEKFFMAQKYLNKLETIEPFYPNLDRLREEVQARRAGRRTRSIAQGSALPYGAVTFPPASAAVEGAVLPAAGPTAERVIPVEKEERKRRKLSDFFQFHIAISCLVVMMILCVMLGVGGMTVLEWLIQGG